MKSPISSSTTSGRKLFLAAIAGFLASLAILIGQNNIFFVPALLIGMWTLARKYDSNKDRIFSEPDWRISCELDRGRPVYLRKIFQPESIPHENRSWWPLLRNHGIERNDFLEYFKQYQPRFAWRAGGETYGIIDRPKLDMEGKNIAQAGTLT